MRTVSSALPLADLCFYQLPHRTGTQAHELRQDDIVTITRATLLKISASSAAIVLDSLLTLLEDVARPYNGIASHPSHVLLSELYIFELIAECCASHWRGDSAAAVEPQDGYSSLWQRAKLPTPERLTDGLVGRLFEAIKLLFQPLPEGYVLPPKTILDEWSSKDMTVNPTEDSVGTPLSTPTGEQPENNRLLRDHSAVIEKQVTSIVEYVTASSWPAAFDYLRNVIYAARTSVSALVTSAPTSPEDERAALVVLRLVSSFWVDSQKLGAVIQELCSSFLHFRKSFQNTVAIVAPLLITRWLDRYPQEFVQLHTMQKRRDTGPDTLFDMTQTVADTPRRRALLYPLQTSLLFLLPDVFEVASNLREAKSGSMTKKVGFLDSLRKALRNRNEQAAYCLVSLLRAARHFDAESDSALMSYAMDVQDEIRDAVFRRFAPGAEGVIFEQDIMTAAFVSLAHLNFESCLSSSQSYLASSAPHSFKVSVIQSCSHFARLRNKEKYQALFSAASAFIQGQLKVLNISHLSNSRAY